MDFVDFNLAKKLNEKGFSCQYPIAMYNERGDFHALYSSVGIENYYDYDNFDEHDCVCPTISQVLKWLREEKNIHIEIRLFVCGYGFDILKIYPKNKIAWSGTLEYKTFEQAALAGISYVLDNLI